MSFAARLKKASKSYKKAKKATIGIILDEGDYQMKIVKPKLFEAKSGKQEGWLIVELPLVVVAGPDKGAKPNRVRFSIINANSQAEQGAEYFKALLDKLGLDPDFDLEDYKPIMSALDGMVVDCRVADSTDGRFQNIYINAPVDASDDEEEEEEEGEEEEEDPKKKSKKKGKKKTAAKKKGKKKGKKKSEPEEEEEDEDEDDLDFDADEGDEDEDEDEDEDDEDWD